MNRWPPSVPKAPASAPWAVLTFVVTMLAASVLIPSLPEVTTTAGMVAAPRTKPEGAWVRARSGEGVVVFRQAGARGQEHSVRAEADVAERLAVVASLVLDFARAPQWCSGLLDVLTEPPFSETEPILLAHYASKQGADQTILLAAKVAVGTAPSRVDVELRSARDRDSPGDKGEPAGLTSAALHLSSIGGGLRTHATLTIRCNAEAPDGAWCAERVGVDAVFATMSGLRAVVRKGGIEVLPRVAEVLDESPSVSVDGPSYESVLNSSVETVTIGAPAGSRDLTEAELAAPLARAPFLTRCGASDDTKVTVRVAVRAGRPIGVTVTTEPRSRAVASCIDHAVRGLRWVPNPKTDFVTTSY
jgi:hypothetical protein